MKFPKLLATALRPWRAAQGAQNVEAATLALHRLVPLTWRGELLLFCGGMLTSFLVAGYWYPYWRIADMDFWVVYNAFLLNSHLPQEYFDHPGYLSILLLSYWLRGLHSIDLLHIQALSGVPPVSDAIGFAQAWTGAVRAGRVLSLMLAMAFVVTFSYLLRALVRDWRVAAFGGFLLAFSGGLAMQMRIMRTELLAGGLFTIALLIFLILARRGSQPWRPTLVGFASLLLSLALLNKIQVLFLICALPVLLLPFGPADTPPRGFWDTGRFAWPSAIAAAVIALVVLFLARDIFSYGLSATNAPTSALAVGNRMYLTVIAVWLGGSMAAYCAVWRAPPLEAVAAMCAAVAGWAIGLLALYARYNPNDVVVVFHPLERMLTFASGPVPGLAGGGPLFDTERVHFLLDAIVGVIARRTFVLSSSPRPTIFLEWFVIAATVFAIRRREWRLVLQVAVLMLTDWGIDTLGMSRGLKQEYFIFTDPLAIIAATLLMTKLTDLQRHRWTYPLGVTLIVAHIMVSQAEPVKHIFRTDGREVLCGLYHNASRVEHFPFCKPQ